MDLRVILSDFLYCKGNLQEFINRRFKSETQMVVDKEAYDYIVRKDGIKFRISQDFFTLADIDMDYNIKDLSPDMVAVDIGSNIGGFCVRASRICKRVLALEPVRYRELQDNIDLNEIKNIEVWPVGLGDGGPVETGWDNILQDIPTTTFDKIINWCGFEPNFLKCDCEGAEKYIPNKHLHFFDRIEMELHHWEKEAARRIEKELRKTHDVTIDHVGSFGSIGVLHATRRK